MDQTDLGDRMKEYERLQAGQWLMPRLPVCVRVDGRTFSRLTRKLAKPYDKRLSVVMAKVAMHLAKETGARCAYTQSDEISLVLHQPDPGSQIMFNGKVHKLVSIIAAMASVAFNSRLGEDLARDLGGQHALFDCRVWNVPNLDEAANCILWREMDAKRNSIQSAARALFSHKQCDRKNSARLQDMLMEEGVNWHDYPSFFKRGTYILRRKETVRREFSPEELEKIPERLRPIGPRLVERSVCREVALPPLVKICNRPDVLFAGSAPVIEGEWKDPTPFSPLCGRE
jgi:tRNA(His) 5'-end guanylyltransferase